MRKIPKEIIDLGKNLKIEPKENNGRTTQIRKYKLITPLFGGGVSPRENDPSKLIRETSIRGQLRFWWRAMRGKKSLADMKMREDAIFGSSDEKVGQSKIVLNLTKVESNKPQNQPHKIFETKTRTIVGWEKLGYAAFPLQPEDGKEFYVTPNIEFEFSISYPSIITYINKDKEKITLITKEEIEPALWAWETFGGIGGRTRRGFGALHLLQIDSEIQQEKSIEQKKKEIVDKLQKIKLVDRNNFNINVPHIGNNSSIKFQSDGDVIKVWGNSIDSLKRFRQVRDKTFIGNRPHFSRNKWSEPDEIRRIFSRRYKHKRLKHQTIRSLNKFPRSEFGLPINFHFQQDEGIEKDFILQGVKSKKIERLSSPLIIRPIKCYDGAISVALVLDTPRIPEDGLEIHYGKDFIEKVNSEKLTKIESQELTNNGLTPLENKTDILQAFLDFFAKGQNI